MQLFNKKGSRGAGGSDLQPWHPNFRNTAELPDIKTVRTKFFVNTGCVILALGALLGWLYTEYTIRATDQDLQAVQARIDKDSKLSREATLRYKTFKDSEPKVTELATFLSGQKLLLSDFLIEIGQNLPEHVVVTEIQVRAAEVSLKGVVKSTPDLASTIASSFEKQLRESPDISARFASVSLSSLNRDSTSGFLIFDMILKFKK